MFAPVRDAYRLWCLTAAQLTLDLDADSVNPIEAGTEPQAVAGTSHREPRATTRFETTTNGRSGTSIPGRAAAASQETS